MSTLPHCRLSLNALSLGTSTTALTWKIDPATPKLNFNDGFQIVDGTADLYVPRSGVYRISAGLATQSTQPADTYFRLILTIANTYYAATGDLCRNSSITQGPQLSGLFHVDVGETINILSSFAGGITADMHPTMSYLSMELAYPA